MKKIFLVILSVIVNVYSMSASTATSSSSSVRLDIIETSDVHGHFFPYDFINKRDIKGTLARVSTFVTRLRKQNPDGVILLDNGDILQGQPINYYYNFIATDKENIAASCINYLKYDAEGWGNHDVEPGHDVYDKWDREVKCPMISANVINTNTGRPYLQPYTIISKKGVKVAVISILTPAIPCWLSEKMWSGLMFEEMVGCARKWIDYVKKNENPDIIIGLFHSGREGGIVTPEYAEDASLKVAREVPGFDIVLFGHDHVQYNEKVKCSDGNMVLAMDPANHAQYVAHAVVTVTKDGDKVISKDITGEIADVRDEAIDEAFMQHFAKNIEDVKKWSDRKIGDFGETVSTRDCFFGSSAFNDLILNLELQLTKADIAFSAPLTFDAKINKGPVTVSDMFKLYKFENALYVVRMTGREIHKFLEMSYDLWVNTMKSPQDHIMLLNEGAKNDNQRSGFKNMFFNFDSAAGIVYDVDVTKPDGQKVIIHKMSDGKPFDENKWYNVAMNSYRANGGGELLTRGAGIPKDSIDSRITYRSDRDQRYYLMKEIERLGTVYPKPDNNWHFIPANWTKDAIERDRKLIFNE